MSYMQDAGACAPAASLEATHSEDELMQIGLNANSNDQPPEIAAIPTLNLDQIASQHAGTARLMHLMFIADNCTSLRVEALRMALKYVLGTCNTDLYITIHRKLTQAVADNCPLPEGLDPENAVPDRDEAWIVKTANKAKVRLEKLDKELNGFKNSCNQEGIRQSFYNKGHHYLDCGDLENALKSYSSARDYCTNYQHTNILRLQINKVNIYLMNWSEVLAHSHKGRIIPKEVPILVLYHGSWAAANKFEAQMRLAIGLAYMGQHKYAEAAKKFLTLKYEHCKFPEILSTTCVATYATLCALATFEREDLYHKVTSSVSFKEFLDMDPSLHEILLNFHNSRFKVCLKLLADMKANLLLDMYLAPHVNPLYKEIHKRAMCQYVTPYMAVDMHKIAEAFSITVTDLEEELVRLIMDDHIKFHIDSQKKVLHAKMVDQRIVAFESALAATREFVRKSQAIILRAALIKNQIMVRGDEADNNSEE